MGFSILSIIKHLWDRVVTLSLLSAPSVATAVVCPQDAERDRDSVRTHPVSRRVGRARAERMSLLQHYAQVWWSAGGRI